MKLSALSMKLFLLLLSASLLIFTSACNQQTPSNPNANNQNPPSIVTSANENKLKLKPSETVKFSAPNVELKAGEAKQADLKITVTPPYHVNSNPPSEKSFIPLEISFENADGITFSKPIYPAGEKKKFEFSPDTPLSVYKNEVTIKLPIKAEKSVSTGQKTLKGKLSFQPCDEQVCYPPQKTDVTLAVNVN